MCQWKSLIQRRPTNVNVYLLIIRVFFTNKVFNFKNSIVVQHSIDFLLWKYNNIEQKKHFLYRSDVSWFIYFLETVCFKQCNGRYKMLFLLWYQMKCQYTREFTKIRAFCCRLRITALFNRIVIKQEKRPTNKDIQQRTITGENFLWKYIWL